MGLLFVFSILLAAFSSGAETAFSSASRIRAYSRLREGARWARTTLGFIENPRRYLTTTLVGTNVGMVTASAITSRFAENSGIPWLEPVLVISLSLFVLVFAEMIPKQLMLVSGEKVVSSLSVPLLVLRVLLYPVIATADLLSSMVVGRRAGSRMFESKGEILGLLTDSSSSAGAVAEKILKMNDVRISDVMRSLDELPSVTVGDPPESILEKMVGSGFSFVLVKERDGRTIRGYADVGSLLESWCVPDAPGVAGIPYFDREEDLVTVVAGLRRSSSPLGIVLGDTGQPVGAAVLDDIIDSLLGKSGASSLSGLLPAGYLEWKDDGAVISNSDPDG